MMFFFMHNFKINEVIAFVCFVGSEKLNIPCTSRSPRIKKREKKERNQCNREREFIFELLVILEVR